MNARQFLTSLMFLFLAGVMAMPRAHAGVGRDVRTGQAIWDAAIHGKSTVVAAESGIKVIGPTGAGVAGTAAGDARIAGAATLPVNGQNLPVSISTNISKADIIAGVLTCATGGYVGCALGVGLPLATAYFSLSGARVAPAQPGGFEINTTACDVNCYQYRLPGDNSVPTTAKFDSPQLACNSYKDDYNRTWGVSPYFFRIENSTASGSGTTAKCTYQQLNKDGTVRGGGTTALSYWSAPPRSGTWYPSDRPGVAGLMAQNNPTPALVDEMAKYGNIIWPGTSKVTGPATVDGAKTVTQNPDGSKTTTQEKKTYQYDDTGKATETGSQKVTTKTNADGTDGGTTTETKTDGPDNSTQTPTDGSQDTPPVDSALPGLPKLYTPKYPDGLTGVWRDRQAALNSSPLMSLKSQLLPSIGGGGSCPAWNIDLTFASWSSYGTTNVAPPCWVWDFGKVVVILSAMFLARALIFGG